MLLTPSAGIIHPHSWGGTRSLVDGEHRADLGFRSDGHTSNCRYDQPRSPSPAIFVEELPSSAGPEKEGWRCVEDQKQCRRRSACIVDGGKEKEVEEMREALKRAKEKWLEEATKLEETRRKLLQSPEGSSLEAEREALLRELDTKDKQIESLKTRLKLAQDQLRSGNKSIVVVESRSISLIDKTTQTSDEDTAVASGDDVKGSDVCPVLSKESSTDIMRSLSADRKVQLADEHATLHELQVQLNSLQQRCDACAEVIHRMNACPYWKPKNELENLVEAQREHVFLKQEIKEKELEKALKENQCKKTEEFCRNLESCIHFLEDCSKQAVQQVEIEKDRVLQRQQAIELDETVWQTASIVRQELSKEEWYWGPASKNVVRRALAGMQMGSFLVRDSSSNFGTYILVVKLKDVEMIPMKANPRGWCLSDRSLHFASVVDLVMYYQKNSLLAVSPALDIKLSYPVKYAECDQMTLELSGSESPMINGHSRKKDYLDLDRDGCAVADDLGPVDMSVLAKHIPSITPCWELVGHALGVGRTVLSIRGTERNPDSKCLCVLEAWVEAGREVSWKKLLDVLQDQQLNDVAQKIRQSLQGEGDVAS